MATTLTPLESQWHTGEEAMHRLLRVPTGDNPTYHGLAPSYGYRIDGSPLVAFGTLDQKGRPWVTIWGGEAGFCRPIARDVLGVRTIADVNYDPVFREFYASSKPTGGVEDGVTNTREIIDDEIVRPDGGKVLAGLSIDLETRDRVKIAGRMIAGAATRTEPGGAVADLQMAIQVEESLGNCPKYLNKKHISPQVPSPRLMSEGTGTPLSQRALDLIAKADLFFIASKHGNGSSMDTNHRGGAPGFLRVFRNRDGDNEDGGGGGVTLVYPEYSGNRLYQTLGNLHSDPRAGLVIPDFETGDVLYLTGRAKVVLGGCDHDRDRAAAHMMMMMPRATKLAVRVDVDEARLVADGLAFRGRVVDYSPYNPPVRKLACEETTTTTTEPPPPPVSSSSTGGETATLLRRETLTPTIARYVFRLSGTGTGTGTGEEEEEEEGKKKRWWQQRPPGQHVTLDFGPELDTGWSHMRDDDPRSLNDDFVRTFTVVGGGTTTTATGGGGTTGFEFEIIARRHGPATRLLATWPDPARVGLELPVLGFAGGEALRMPSGEEEEEGESVFVAGGVGITPLVAQAEGVLGKGDGKGKGKLRVLWSLRAEDLPLAVAVLDRIKGLGPVTRVFVTGEWPAGDGDGDGEEGVAVVVERIRGTGAKVVEGRRMGKGDVLMLGLGEGEGEGKRKRKFYCCAGPGMLRDVMRWTEGEEFAFESFEY
ncbi:hypothetical protein F4809DRAFT_645194 [Biscogniauxia mediterranea]|nr:hypothetical protein F4809DRAFT_645194 [Biscogniauxia mediterranea]